MLHGFELTVMGASQKSIVSRASNLAANECLWYSGGNMHLRIGMVDPEGNFALEQKKGENKHAHLKRNNEVACLAL
jgi:hypothetical protein